MPATALFNWLYKTLQKGYIIYITKHGKL